jgi:uncharacterized protein (TIGR02266 family)
MGDVASDEGDRRIGSRIPVEMWVEESTDHELYFQRSANISSGGIYLENTIPHPVGTVVSLAFVLPGDTAKVRVKGEIVNADNGQLGMGVKFVQLDDLARDRIRAFVARAEQERSPGAGGEGSGS